MAVKGVNTVAQLADIKQALRGKSGGELSPFEQRQQGVAELNQTYKLLTKQTNITHQLLKEEIKQLKLQNKAAQHHTEWTQRLHDRMDALLVENRVTNLLLSEMVALQQSVIHDDTDGVREAIRTDAYNKVLNGE